MPLLSRTTTLTLSPTRSCTLFWVGRCAFMTTQLGCSEAPQVHGSRDTNRPRGRKTTHTTPYLGMGVQGAGICCCSPGSGRPFRNTCRGWDSIDSACQRERHPNLFLCFSRCVQHVSELVIRFAPSTLPPLETRNPPSLRQTGTHHQRAPVQARNTGKVWGKTLASLVAKLARLPVEAHNKEAAQDSFQRCWRRPFERSHKLKNKRKRLEPWVGRIN